MRVKLKPLCYAGLTAWLMEERKEGELPFRLQGCSTATLYPDRDWMVSVGVWLQGSNCRSIIKENCFWFTTFMGLSWWVYVLDRLFLFWQENIKKYVFNWFWCTTQHEKQMICKNKVIKKDKWKGVKAKKRKQTHPFHKFVLMDQTNWTWKTEYKSPV